MASRRSRLKAVANLPIRRKPAATPPETEGSKILKSQGDKNSEEGEQELKGCEDINNANVIPNDVTSSELIIEQEPENLNSEVPSTESSNHKLVKSPSAPTSQFGRRVKPSVSLTLLKDRPQRELNTEGNINQNEKPNEQENQSVLQDKNNCSSLENGINKAFMEMDTTNPDVPPNTILEAAQTEKTSSKLVKTIHQVDATQEKEDSSPSEHVLTSVNFVPGTNNERTVQLNIKLPASSVKENVFVNNSDFNIKYSQEVANVQRSDVSQNNNDFSEFSLDHLTSHSPVQYNSTGTRRNLNFKQKKPKFNDFARKVADARREFQRKYEKIPPDRSSLRMIDLIFYNPSTNPMESKSKLERKDSHPGDEELLNEGRVDDPDPIDKSSDFSPDDDLRGEDFGKMPVPQVKIGLNGEIILDEKSLIIETTDAKKGREDLQNSAPVFEDRTSKTCYYKRKTQKSRDWSDLETKRFYKALNTIGTDFSLMQKYFPIRTRLELKNKFKREEKLNRNLVDKALNNPSEFDITQFEKYLATEKQIEDEETERRLQRKIKIKRNESRIRTKSSLLAREITEPDENVVEYQTSLNMDNGRTNSNEKSMQANEINLSSGKYSLRGTEANRGVQQSSSLIFEGVDSSYSPSSRVFTNVSVNELNNANKIRDAFDEIQNVNHSEKEISRGEMLDSLNRTENGVECGELRSNQTDNDVVDEFYQAVVSLSASLKSDECKTLKSSKIGKRMRTGLSKNDKTNCGRKMGKKSKDYPFLSTLDIETYESDCDNYSSSDDSNDNSIISTKTITDQDFIKLLAANAKNMKESKIQFQITEGCSLEKNVEIILDNVPSIALSEI